MGDDDGFIVGFDDGYVVGVVVGVGAVMKMEASWKFRVGVSLPSTTSFPWVEMSVTFRLPGILIDPIFRDATSTVPIPASRRISPI